MFHLLANLVLLNRLIPSLLYLSESLLGILIPYLYFKYVKKEQLTRFFYAVFIIQIIFSNIYCNFVGNFPLFPFIVHCYFNLTCIVHACVLTTWRELKPKWYLYLISLPSAWYLGYSAIGTVIASPFLIFTTTTWSAGLQDYILSFARMDILGLNLIVLILSIHSFYISLKSPAFCKEVVHLDLTPNREDCGDQVKELQSDIEIHQDESKILRVFQLTDVHLGPFMSKQKLFTLCEKIAKDPKIDLVLITGDMETYDCAEDMTGLKEAIAPLKEISNRVVACLGNHDYEVYEKVKEAYRENNIPLLEDEEMLVTIPRWSKLMNKTVQVQIVGSLFSYNHDMAANMTDSLFKKFPRKAADVKRIFLIHNPAMLSCIPLADTCDVVFSGHLHGGQIRVGWRRRWTIVKLVQKILKLFGKQERFFKVPFPDQGLYGRGMLRLYSHRGTGHYGFPLRIGIPSEHSLIQLYF